MRRIAVITDRSELIRMFVLNEISDDYENFHWISEQVTKLGTKCGMKIRSSEILDALGNLVGAGLAKAYRLSTTQPVKEIAGFPNRDEIERCYVKSAQSYCYFWITGQGRHRQSSIENDWPFDDDGSLRKDWSPPDD